MIRQDEYINIPFEPLRRWTKEPIKINWKTKMKIEFFLKIQKQEDTQYYTRRQDEYE
jgi:hypothetical protein